MTTQPVPLPPLPPPSRPPSCRPQAGGSRGPGGNPRCSEAEGLGGAQWGDALLGAGEIKVRSNGQCGSVLLRRLCGHCFAKGCLRGSVATPWIRSADRALVGGGGAPHDGSMRGHEWALSGEES